MEYDLVEICLKPLIALWKIFIQYCMVMACTKSTKMFLFYFHLHSITEVLSQSELSYLEYLWRQRRCKFPLCSLIRPLQILLQYYIIRWSTLSTKIFLYKYNVQSITQVLSQTACGYLGQLRRMTDLKFPLYAFIRPYIYIGSPRKVRIDEVS